MDMYNRQKELGLNINQKILVIGVGGVGWWVTKAFAMSGVKDITIFDADIIEIHNLNRLDVPESCLGRNKVDMLKSFINQMRSDCDVHGFPIKFNPDVISNDFDYIVDCTDVHKVQLENQKYAQDNKIKYIKVGYNGFSVSVNDGVGEWDTNPEGTEDGYTIIPSYVVPAMAIASLAVHKVLTESDKQIACKVDDLYVY